MLIPFEQASYLAQVRRLRAMAERSLDRFPIHVTSCKFLSHWENATFQITASGSRKFLLRIHRRGYHTEAALQEELDCLRVLSQDSSLSVPKPVPSKNHRFLEFVSVPFVPEGRFCSLLEWIDGRFMHKAPTLSRVHELGVVIGRIHRNTESFNVTHRRYWDADGLVGKHPKFGSIEDIPGISAKNQQVLSRGRRLVFRRLIEFQKAFPHKQGLIHADLHFGNIFVAESGLAAIDFDDCGFGFHAYDLAVPLITMEFLLWPGRRREIPKFRETLIEGYATEMKWEEPDQEILPYMITARRLVMLGWLRSRSDNPRLRAALKRSVARTVCHLQIWDKA